MKKIIVQSVSLEVPWWREAAIFIQTYPFDDIHVKSIVSSDGKKRTWYCDTYQYAIAKPGETFHFGYYFSKDFSKKDFMMKIKELYPEDFYLFLWHPEVEYGNWNP